MLRIECDGHIMAFDNAIPFHKYDVRVHLDTVIQYNRIYHQPILQGY